ncbi:MAG: hypothetical protein H7240_02860 [Glaciimonas sp.]|nr:hypothetical protein [Glaciimonas sp.]
MNIISRAMSLIDFHVAATLALRLWILLAGTITVLLVPIFLTQLEQGYYFTFASVLALQIFFELGLNYVLVQFTAAQMPWLHLTKDGCLGGDADRLHTLGALVSKVFKVYQILAILFFCLIGTGGAYFFASSNQLQLDQWLPSWLLMTAFTAGNLFFSPFLAIAEGTGKVGQIARLRTIQSIFGYLCAWLCLIYGYGLLAMPLIAGANLVGAVIWWRLDGKFITALRRLGRTSVSSNHLNWRRDIFPFQWKIAVSWISGYLVFQMFNPVIFKYHGPIDAGAVGLALAVFGALTTLSMSWVNAKAPEITKQLNAGNRFAARAVFRRQFTVSFLVNFSLTIGVIISISLMRVLHIPAVDRLPDGAVLNWMAIAAVVNQVVFSLAVYMRAHGEEPLMAPSIITGLATLAVLAFTGSSNIQLMMALYAGVLAFLCLPWVATLFFRKYWKESLHSVS